MRLPVWTWSWAWRRFKRWALLEGRLVDVGAIERWRVVRWSIGSGIRHHYLRPAMAALQHHSPTWLLLMRLPHRGHGWRLVPSEATALHVWHRLGINVHEGEFIRFLNGNPVAKGVEDDELNCCEFWPLAEDGIENEPRSARLRW